MRRRRRGRLRLPTEDGIELWPNSATRASPRGQAASARVARGCCATVPSDGERRGGRFRDGSKASWRTLSCRSSAIGAAAMTGRRWSGGRQERRDLESNAIEPLAALEASPRFWPQALDLARRLGKPAAHFDLGCFKTPLPVARARGVLRAQYLRALGSTRAFWRADLSHVLRHAAISAPCARSCWADGSDGRVKVWIPPSMQPETSSRQGCVRTVAP